MFVALFILALRAVVVSKLVILGILSFTSFTLVLRVALVPKLVISGVLSSIFFILALYTFFLTASYFTASLRLLKQTGTATNLSKFNWSN